MKIQVDIDVEQVTAGTPRPAAEIAAEAVRALRQVSFQVRSVTHAVGAASVIYNAGEDPNAPEDWKKL